MRALRRRCFHCDCIYYAVPMKAWTMGVKNLKDFDFVFWRIDPIYYFLRKDTTKFWICNSCHKSRSNYIFEWKV